MTPVAQATPRRPALLLSGRPGIGKTTVIRRLAELLAAKRIAGFYTEEIRVDGRRQGFRVTTFSGGRGILAHVKIPGREHVGRYGVDRATFEQLVLPELARTCDALLIDEIGKMECFSSGFVAAVRDLLQGPTPLVATVALAGPGFITEVKRRADVEVWPVTRANRDELPGRIVDRGLQLTGGPGGG